MRQQDSLRAFRRRAWWRTWGRMVVVVGSGFVVALIVVASMMLGRGPTPVHAIGPTTTLSPVPTTPQRAMPRFDMNASASVATSQAGSEFNYIITVYNLQTTPMTVTLRHTLDDRLVVTGMNRVVGKSTVPCSGTIEMAGFSREVVLVGVQSNADAEPGEISYAAIMDGVVDDGSVVIVQALPVSVQLTGIAPDRLRPPGEIFLPLMTSSRHTDVRVSYPGPVKGR